MLARLFDRITRLALRWQWPTIILTVVILGAGIWAFTGLNLELLPSIEFPQTVVVAQWPDAEDAEALLREVTVPLEEALAAVPGVVNVESTTSNALAIITVRNEFGLSQDRVLTDVKEAVAGIEYPAGMESPQVLNFSFSDLPVVVASVSSAELKLSELKELVDAELVPQLHRLEAVSEVTLSGGQELPGEGELAVAEAGEPEPAPAPTETPSPTATPDPARLPDELIQVASMAGQSLETAADLTPTLMRQLTSFGPTASQLLFLLTPDNLRLLPPESIALLPADVVAAQPAELRAELDALAGEFGGAGALALAEQAPPEADVAAPLVDPVALPESWVAAGALVGQQLETTEDVSATVMGGVIGFAPELLDELEPSMWRALSPEALALAVPVAEETLDPLLLVQLGAIMSAANGEDPAPAPIPDSWLAAAQASDLAITTTADLTLPNLFALLSGAPELAADLTEELILGLPLNVMVAIPAELTSSLSAGTQEAMTIIVARAAAAAQPAEVADEVEIDPARLPQPLIDSLAFLGITLESASDITPDYMRLLTGFGPQAGQFLAMLTPDNLRALDPEVIALLPLAFVETLETELRQELDDLAAEFGGAGALAAAEAVAAEAAAAGAPPLTGIWVEPGPNGEPSQFATAADILNNVFVPGAATFLNVFPSAQNVEDPAAWLGALSPDVLAYLEESEPGFVAALLPTTLELMSPESLEYLLAEYPGAFPPELAARLADVAAGTVAVFVPDATVTRTDGNPAVVVSIYKAGDANTVDVAHRVFDQFAAYEDQRPAISTSLVFEQATFIEDSISGVSREGVLGGVFAIVVILVFLSGNARRWLLLLGAVGVGVLLGWAVEKWTGRNLSVVFLALAALAYVIWAMRRRAALLPGWRPTVVTAVSIPLSIFAALLLMRVVPPTIGVWLQNLVEQSDNGLLAFFARLFPTSVTLNIMTLSGLTVAIGRVVDDSIVVLENSYRYIQRGDDPRHAIVEGTREVAIAIFSATVTTVAVFLPLGLIGGIIGSFFLPFGLTVSYALAASFVVSITVVPALTLLLIRKENIPPEQETELQRVYTPTLRLALGNRWLTLLIAAAIFGGSILLLARLPRSFIPTIGEPTINIAVSLPPGTGIAETDDLVTDLEARLSELTGISTIQAEVGSGGGLEAFFGGSGVRQNTANLTISVVDQDDLNDLTARVRSLAENALDADNVSVSAASQTGFSGFSLVLTGSSQTELETLAPLVKAALAGVDVDGDGLPDITNVTSSADGSALGGSASIIRIDGDPAVSFGGDLETENTIGVTNEAKAAIVEAGLPDGVTITEGFESEQQIEGFRSMGIAIAYSIALVYIIMALTFRSLIHPFTILFSLPFALVGAAIALYLTKSVLGISAMIGFMMLVGIVVTNGIVLMELVQQLRHRGLGAYDALVEAGRTRLRPIWMTALTAILALIPLAASQQAGAIIASELARAVMGGLLVSTALTLLVVPVVYSLFDGLATRLGSLRRAKRPE